MNSTFATVYESRDRGSCMEMRLVLESVGLKARVSPHAERWRLLVAESQVDVAIAELSAYQKDEREEAFTPPTERFVLDQGIVESGLVFAFLIIACSLAGWSSPSGPAFTSWGQVDAGLVQDGQWWRSITALTLHADWPHLLSNLVFGALFLGMAGKWLGGGMAVLLTVIGGASGNLLNAFLRDAPHASLGASTAVFAALGIAVANALRPSIRSQSRAMQRWSPLIAGGLLLAMNGTGGERTDVGAHFAGFFAGLVYGWLSTSLPKQWLTKSWVQWCAVAIGALAILGAWAVAFQMET